MFLTSSTFDRSDLDANLADAALFADGFPHRVFTALRRHKPVKWYSFPEDIPGDHDKGFWVLSKHEDIQAASRNHELFSAIDGPQLSHQPEIAGMMLVSMDGQDHTRQRRLISAGFTPRMIKQSDRQIRRWAEAIVDGALHRGECDFVLEIVYPLPMNMIADMVGIPVEDREWLFAMTNDFLQANTPGRQLSEEDRLRVQVEVFEYAQKLGQKNESTPRTTSGRSCRRWKSRPTMEGALPSVTLSWICSSYCSSWRAAKLLATPYRRGSWRSLSTPTSLSTSVGNRGPFPQRWRRSSGGRHR